MTATDWNLDALERAFRNYLDRVAAQPVAPRVARGDVTRELETRYDLREPRPLAEVVDHIESLLVTANLHTTHPRYFGLFNPSVRFSAVVADLLVAASNPQNGAWFHSPVATEVEEFVLRFFARALGIEYGSAHFTSGGSEANLTAVLTALAHQFPEVKDGGVRAIAGQPVFFASSEAHHSFEKTAQHSGLGRAALRIIEADERDRMRPDVLERAIADAKARGERPFFVGATAGTTSTGAIDPLVEIERICHAHGLWFHVDAAWGGAAALSPTLRVHLAGIERADSITCDAHKWLSAPMGAGMFFTSHRDAASGAFAIDTPYVPKGEAAPPDAYATSLQWSRRFIGLKVFMQLAELGADGLARQIEHHEDVAQYLAAQLRADGWNLVSDSPLAMVCFNDEAHRDAESIRALAAAVVANGKCWISPLVRAGRDAAIRACITNYATTRDDIDVLISELARARDASNASPRFVQSREIK